MADISKITLPSGSTYDIKDATARSLIESLNSYGHYLGVTSTAITDGAKITSIIIGETTIVPKTGDIVNSGKKEFIYSSTGEWQEFGDLSALKGLAYKASASGSFTPSGSVSQPTFSGTGVKYTPTGSVTVGSITPSGSVSAPTFTGTQATITSTVTASASAATKNYTPAGSVTVTPNTTTIYSITGVGTVPSCTLPSLTTSVSNETLTLGWSAGSFSAGTTPTMSSATVATGIKSASFTGTSVGLSASATYTPSGSNAAPTFTGTAVTPTGSFSGTEATITAKGTVSKPTFTGTSGTVSVS